jgi:predicted DNA-binding transcriptional regulator AlpA
MAARATTYKRAEVERDEQKTQQQYTEGTPCTSTSAVSVSAPAPPQTFHLDRRADKLIATAPGSADDDLLSTRQVADWLGLSEQWLEIGRCRGYGPTFVKIGRRVRYRREDVLRFLAQRRHASTAEYAPRNGAIET